MSKPIFYTERDNMPTLEMKRRTLSRGLSERINGLLLLTQTLKDSKSANANSAAMRSIIRKDIHSALESLGEGHRNQYVKMALDTDAVLSLEDISFDLKRNREEVLEDLRQLARDVGPIANFSYQLAEFNRNINLAKSLQFDTLLTDLEALVKGNQGKKCTISYPEYLLDMGPNSKANGIGEAIRRWLLNLKEFSSGHYSMAFATLTLEITYPFILIDSAKRHINESGVPEHRILEDIKYAVNDVNRKAEETLVTNPLPGIDAYSTHSGLVMTSARTPIRALPLAKSYVGFGVRSRETPHGLEVFIPGLGMGRKGSYSDALVKEEVSIEDITELVKLAQTHLASLDSLWPTEDEDFHNEIDRMVRELTQDRDGWAVNNIMVKFPQAVSYIVPCILGAIVGSDGNNTSRMSKLLDDLDLSVYSEDVQDSLLALAWYTLYLVEEIQTYLKVMVGLKEMRVIAKIANSVKEAV